MRKSPPLKLSFRTNKRQVIVIIFILIIFFAIPFSYEVITNPQMLQLSDHFNTLPLSGAKSSEFIFTIPLTSHQIDLSVLNRNPELIIYVGGALIVCALLIGVVFFKSIMRK